MRELEDTLAFVTASVDGAQYAAIGSMDGLLIEQQPKEGADLTAYAAEMTNVLLALERLGAAGLAAGQLRELMITSERLSTYVRLVDPEIFLVIVMNAAGNLGKARLYSDQVRAELLEALA